MWFGNWSFLKGMAVDKISNLLSLDHLDHQIEHLRKLLMILETLYSVTMVRDDIRLFP